MGVPWLFGIYLVLLGPNFLSAFRSPSLSSPSSSEFDLLPAPCTHRGSRYPHYHHRLLPQSHPRPHRPHRLLGLLSPPRAHFRRVTLAQGPHLYTPPTSVGPVEEWQPVAPAPPGAFWTEQLGPGANSYDGGGGGVGAGGPNGPEYLPIVRVVEAYEPGQGVQEGQDGSSQEVGGAPEQGTHSEGPGRHDLGPGQQDHSPQAESPHEPGEMLSPSPTSPSQDPASSVEVSFPQYGGQPGVTYTRFRLPAPGEMITEDSPPPRTQQGPGGQTIPGVIYRVESSPEAVIPTGEGAAMKKRKKINGRKKKPKKKLVPGSEVDPMGPYSVNKIIVIEEDPQNGAGFSRPDPSQIEKPLPDQFVNLQDFQSTQRLHFPGPTSPPIKTIKDLHDRLNVTLFQQPIPTQEPGPRGPEAPTTISPFLIELISKISSPPQTPPPTTPPTTFNLSNSGPNSISKHITGSSGYFMKGNQFAFENSWNGGATTESPKTGQESGPTAPTVYYFTSQRNFLPPPPTKASAPSREGPSTSSSSSLSPIPAPASSPSVPGTVKAVPSSGSGKPELLAARKHFGAESSSSASRHAFSGGAGSHGAQSQGAQERVDMTKVVSIVIGFCVAMMALAAVILMVLHRDTVTVRLRHLGDLIESRYPNLRRPGAPESGPGPLGTQPPPPTDGPGLPPRSQQSAPCNLHSPLTHIQSHDGRRKVSVPVPPPPPPPPPPQPAPAPTQIPTLKTGPVPGPGQDLIEQIIGRPGSTAGTATVIPIGSSKKTRQYFSRVHRWVPKRPPLPEDLKSSSSSIMNARM